MKNSTSPTATQNARNTMVASIAAADPTLRGPRNGRGNCGFASARRLLPPTALREAHDGRRDGAEVVGRRQLPHLGELALRRRQRVDPLDQHVDAAAIPIPTHPALEP